LATPASFFSAASLVKRGNMAWPNGAPAALIAPAATTAIENMPYSASGSSLERISLSVCVATTQTVAVKAMISEKVRFPSAA